MRFVRAIWTREYAKRRRRTRERARIILFCKTKREQYLSSSSLPRSFYSEIRSNKHSPEADSREDSKRRERGKRRHILNQLDREVESRLADPHRRFPSSRRLRWFGIYINRLSDYTVFRIRTEQHLVTPFGGRRWIYSSRCRTLVAGECAANTRLDLQKRCGYHALSDRRVRQIEETSWIYIWLHLICLASVRNAVRQNEIQREEENRWDA